MRFISDISPYIITIVCVFIALVSILLFIKKILNAVLEEPYGNLPIEHINGCAICRKHVDSKEKLLFYEGNWIYTGDDSVQQETIGESEGGQVYYTGKTRIVKPTEQYYAFDPRKKIFLAVCNSCKSKKWRYELSSELKELFGRPIRIFLSVIVVVFLLFLLNSFKPQIFFGQFSNAIKAIFIFSFINTALHVLLCFPSIFTLLFTKDYISRSGGKVRIESEIVQNAFKKQGRDVVISDGSFKKTENIK
jgi:hypothetical protein